MRLANAQYKASAANKPKRAQPGAVEQLGLNEVSANLPDYVNQLMPLIAGFN